MATSLLCVQSVIPYPSCEQEAFEEQERFSIHMGVGGEGYSGARLNLQTPENIVNTINTHPP